MKRIYVGMIGFGTVGTGVAKVLKAHRRLIERKLGAALVLKRVADLDIRTDRGVKLDSGVLTKRAQDVIEDPDISIVVELVGGLEPAQTFVLAAMKHGKHVVTANKALLAECGAQIMEASYRHQRDLAFEGSVGGGIPIIRAIREGLSANRIDLILGILNGTANYILTKMTDEGQRFNAVLKEAQKKGYAEADPSLDIKGTDTTHKLAILISLAYGTPVDVNKIYTEGISGITPLDIEFAKELGYKIKLLAIARGNKDVIEARVHPTLIPETHLLSKVDGNYNAMFLSGSPIGSAMFYGEGAGMMPTSSAVVGDIIDVARNILKGVSQRVPPFSHVRDSFRSLTIKDIKNVQCRYYVRFSALDRPSVLSRISGILGKNKISIHSVIQKGRKVRGGVPIFMLTHEAREANIRKALKEVDRLPITVDKTMLIRIEDKI